MILTREHIGKKVVYKGRSGYFIPHGFQMDQINEYVYGEVFDGHEIDYSPHKYCIPGQAYFALYNKDCWDLYEPTDTWDKVYKKFGCNEPYVRELVALIFKESKKIKGEKHVS